MVKGIASAKRFGYRDKPETSKGLCTCVDPVRWLVKVSLSQMGPGRVIVSNNRTNHVWSPSSNGQALCWALSKIQLLLLL